MLKLLYLEKTKYYLLDTILNEGGEKTKEILKDAFIGKCKEPFDLLNTLTDEEFLAFIKGESEQLLIDINIGDVFEDLNGNKYYVIYQEGLYFLYSFNKGEAYQPPTHKSNFVQLISALINNLGFNKIDSIV